MNKEITPWDLAKEQGQTIIRQIMGPMVGVYYPYRKSADLYVFGPEGENQIVHCCQKCDCDFSISEFPEHVRMHNRQRVKFPKMVILKERPE